MNDDIPYAISERRLRQAGLRPTQQRMALTKLLFDDGDRHVTAEDLRDDAARAGVSVSLATIYNTLHQFTAAGLLREVMVTSEKSYFDTNVTPHHHFFLERENRLMDIPRDDILLRNLPTPPAGTRIASVDVVIRIEDE